MHYLFMHAAMVFFGVHHVTTITSHHIHVCSVMAVPATVMNYTLYDKLRPVFGTHVAPQHAFIAPLFAGAVARGW